MAKLTAGPSVITANRLADGAVVYLSADGGWSEQIDQATAAHSDALAALLTAAAKAVADNIVVDVNAVSADLSLRERIRRAGPTVRPDLARATGA
jgi:hypothetical protein